MLSKQAKVFFISFFGIIFIHVGVILSEFRVENVNNQTTSFSLISSIISARLFLPYLFMWVLLIVSGVVVVKKYMDANLNDGNNREKVK